MTRRTAILSLVLLMLVSAGCSRRRTRQFIVPGASGEWLGVGEWEIEAPSVVAFRDVIDIDQIADTTMFWVSIRAKRLRSDDPGANTDLVIDSVSIVFSRDTTRHWRKPTRVAPYNSADDTHVRKAFDFFGDQGIVIPAGISIIKLEFIAFSMSPEGQVVDRYPMKFDLVRNEGSHRFPVLRE